jgi:hypothetical protein
MTECKGKKRRGSDALACPSMSAGSLLIYTLRPGCGEKKIAKTEKQKGEAAPGPSGQKGVRRPRPQQKAFERARKMYYIKARGSQHPKHMKADK